MSSTPKLRGASLCEDGRRSLCEDGSGLRLGRLRILRPVVLQTEHGQIIELLCRTDKLIHTVCYIHKKLPGGDLRLFVWRFI